MATEAETCLHFPLGVALCLERGGLRILAERKAGLWSLPAVLQCLSVVGFGVLSELTSVFAPGRGVCFLPSRAHTCHFLFAVLLCEDLPAAAFLSQAFLIATALGVPSCVPAASVSSGHCGALMMLARDLSSLCNAKS